jgi:CRISPR/Cas system CMR-associated protein Cmr5 small subunit
MNNLDQIRARNAFRRAGEAAFRGQEGGDALSGFPALVINNGLLSALAFAASNAATPKGAGYRALGDAIAQHLADPDVALVPTNRRTLQNLLEELVRMDSYALLSCTEETLFFLNYLRRFVKAGQGDSRQAQK